MKFDGRFRFLRIAACSIVTSLIVEGAKADRVPPVPVPGAVKTQWENVTPPGVAFVFGVGVDSASRVYAGTDIGVFRSTDGGGTWAALEGETRAGSFAFDPKDPRIIYVGGDGVLKSIDDGGSWRAMNVGLTDTLVNVLTIDPSAPLTIFAGTGDAVFKSANGAASWQRLDLGTLFPAAVRSIVIDPASSQTIYVGTDYFAFKSLNGGSDWEVLGTGIFEDGQPVNVEAIMLDPQLPNTVYAGTGCSIQTEGPPCGDGVYRSEDGGTSWIAWHAGMGPYTPVWSLISLQDEGILIAGTYYGVYWARSGASSWLSLDDGLPGLNIKALAHDKKTDSLYAAGPGVLKLTPVSALRAERTPRDVPFRTPLQSLRKAQH